MSELYKDKKQWDHQWSYKHDQSIPEKIRNQNDDLDYDARELTKKLNGYLMEKPKDNFISLTAEKLLEIKSKAVNAKTKLNKFLDDRKSLEN